MKVVPAATESALVTRARSGDRGAFAELYEPLERQLASFLYRMVAVRQDAEDLAQETAVRALEGIADFPEEVSFRTWMFRMAVQAALDYLDAQKRWRPDALLQAGKRTAEDPPVRRRLQKLHKSGLHTTYDIREHIDFCFTFMGRTIPPHEQAALLLAEVYGFSRQEAAEVLGTSREVAQFRLQQARQALVDHFETRCSLINKAGSCGQCASLHTMLYEDRRRTELALFQIELEPRPAPPERAGTFDQRLAIVRTIDPLHAEGTRFHEALMEFTRQVNGY